MKNKFIISAFLIATLALFVPQVLRAQDGTPSDQDGPPTDQDGTPTDARSAQPDQPDQTDQVAPGVARVSIIQGEVSTMPSGNNEWVASTVNAPLQRGDKVSTNDRSRAEIQLDFANVLRLNQQSQVNVADLTRQRIQLQLSQGMINYDVLKGSDAEAEIDTPNVAVHPNGEGSYRISVDPNSGDTVVTVRKGQVEVSTPQGSTNVQQGQTITIQGTDNPQYQVNDAPGRDDWDEWNQKRDSQILQAQSWNHTNKYYTGTEDLDRYGHWNNAPGYGDVWTPDAGSDFVPYQDGRWVWEPYYGWTWVSYEPWGWAPYHYGRWFYYGNSWAWWPGPVGGGYYPMWSPAYVSFFGFGGRRGGFGAGFGFGSIGWCPIGPFDSYRPWYGRGFHNSFNSMNFNNINNRGGQFGRQMTPLASGSRYPRMSNLESAYTNANVRRGITTVSARDFGNGRVPRNTTPISAETLRQGQMLQGGVPVAPTRQSLSPSGRMATGPASATRAQTFFSRNQSSNAALRLSGRNSNNAIGPANARGNAGSNVRSGWQGFGQSGQNGNARSNIGNMPGPGRQITQNNQSSTPTRGRPTAAGQNQSRPQTPNTGWQRFGTGNSQRGVGSQTPQTGRSNAQPFRSSPRSQPAQSGWSRTKSAPETTNRQPMRIGKPIISERAPSNYGGNRGGYSGGNYGSPRSAPSGGYYGGGRSAPSGGYYGGGRSAPSGGYSGGGNRGGSYSAPSSGGNRGGGYSAPSGGNRGGYGSGGNRGGGGGGSRGGGGGGGSRGGSSGGHSRH